MSWRETTCAAIAQHLGQSLEGPDFKVTQPASFDRRVDGSVTFLVRASDEMSERPESCLVIALPELVQDLRAHGFSVVAHPEPKYAFSKVASQIMAVPRETGTHASAIIGPDVKLGNAVSIGPYCVLEGEISVGDSVTLEPHVQLSNRVTIGNGSIVRGGTRIGYDPFSFGASTNGNAFLFPANGSVKIGASVDIFCNCSIVGGATDDTVIEDGVRICNQAHIGNTVRIGAGSTICAATDISARVTIGPRCWIAQSAAIRQGLNVGADCTVGMGAVVINDVPAGSTVMGVPARVSSQHGD